jgi:hypothetical protein
VLDCELDSLLSATKRSGIESGGMIGDRGISKKSAEKRFEFTLGNLGVGGMASLQPASHSLHGLDFQLWIIQFSINGCSEIVEVSP